MLATGFHDNEGVMGGQSLYENSTFSKPADIEQTNLSLVDVDLKLKAFLKVSNQIKTELQNRASVLITIKHKDVLQVKAIHVLILNKSIHNCWSFGNTNKPLSLDVFPPQEWLTDRRLLFWHLGEQGIDLQFPYGKITFSEEKATEFI